MDPTAPLTRERVTGIDRVIAGHDARKRVEERENMWSIDTGTAFPAMNWLTLARIDVDPPEVERRSRWSTADWRGRGA